MLREEDEMSETGESEGEDEDEGPGHQAIESEPEVTEVDMNDMDMNKVCCIQNTHNKLYIVFIIQSAPACRHSTTTTRGGTPDRRCS